MSCAAHASANVHHRTVWDVQFGMYSLGNTVWDVDSNVQLLR